MGAWVSADTRRRLETELDDIAERLRDVEHAIAEARSRATGVIDNGPLAAALEEHGILQRRMERIQDLLAEAAAAEHGSQLMDGVVREGLVVTVRDDDGEFDVLVGHTENRTANLLVTSPEAPLGRALIGASVGETVTFASPGGLQTVVITAVRAL